MHCIMKRKSRGDEHREERAKFKPNKGEANKQTNLKKDIKGNGRTDRVESHRNNR